MTIDTITSSDDAEFQQPFALEHENLEEAMKAVIGICEHRRMAAQIRD